MKVIDAAAQMITKTAAGRPAVAWAATADPARKGCDIWTAITSCYPVGKIPE